MENQKKGLEIELQKWIQENEEMWVEIKEQKQSLNSKIEEMRSESQELNDQIIVLRLDNNWDSALTKQKIEFLENKISELQTQNKSDCQKYEERLDTLK